MVGPQPLVGRPGYRARLAGVRAVVTAWRLPRQRQRTVTALFHAASCGGRYLRPGLPGLALLRRAQVRSLESKAQGDRPKGKEEGRGAERVYLEASGTGIV